MAHAQKPDFFFCVKWTSPFKSAGGCQFSWLLAAEVCASAVVMQDTPCSEVVWRILATNSIHQFPLHFPSRASPCAITFQPESITWKPWSLETSTVPVNEHQMDYLRCSILHHLHLTGIGTYLWCQGEIRSRRSLLVGCRRGIIRGSTRLRAFPFPPLVCRSLWFWGHTQTGDNRTVTTKQLVMLTWQLEKSHFSMNGKFRWYKKLSDTSIENRFIQTGGGTDP